MFHTCEFKPSYISRIRGYNKFAVYNPDGPNSEAWTVVTDGEIFTMQFKPTTGEVLVCLCFECGNKYYTNATEGVVI